MIEEKTFNVTIKTLAVDNKKMTLSLFKQLPLSCLFKTQSYNHNPEPKAHSSM